jgi:hypothetical protein
MSITEMQNPATTSSFTGIPVTITNQLSIPLDIYDVFNPAASGQTEPYLYTKLGTIAAGATGTVTTIRQVAQLEAMYSGTITELQGWYYQQFPIKLMSGTQFSFGNPPPLSYTIADSDRESMIQSFLFHKFAMANPNSVLTSNLNAALKSTDPTAVDTFFAGTQNFQSCTLSSWNAVMTWLTMFTSGWQGPYYLYETTPANPPQNYVPVLVGTVNIVSSASANSATLTLCSQDSSGNVQPMNPPQTSSVVMAGDGTMVDGNPGQDVSLTLTPVWMNTIQTTMNGNQPQTSYIAGPVLTGTVAGQQVVSTQVLIPLPSQSQSGGGSSQPSVASIAQQTFSTLCQVVGLLGGLALIYQLARGRNVTKATQEEEAKSEATDESQYEEELTTVDDDAASDTAQIITEYEGDITTNSSGVDGGYSEISQSQQEGVLTEAINSDEETMESEVDTELEDGYTPTSGFENAVSSAEEGFSTAQQQVDSGDVSGASTTVSNTATELQQTVDQNAADMVQGEENALTQSADAATEASTESSELNEEESEYEQSETDAETDSGYESGDEVPEDEPIPEFEG